MKWRPMCILMVGMLVLSNIIIIASMITPQARAQNMGDLIIKDTRYVLSGNYTVDGNITVINGTLIVRNATVTILQDFFHKYRIFVHNSTFIIENSTLTVTTKLLWPRLMLEMVVENKSKFVSENSKILFPGWINVTDSNVYINNTKISRVSGSIPSGLNVEENNDCPLLLMNNSFVEIADSRIENYSTPYSNPKFYPNHGDSIYLDDNTDANFVGLTNVSFIDFEQYSGERYNITAKRLSYAMLIIKYKYDANDAPPIYVNGVQTNHNLTNTGDAYNYEYISLYEYGIDTVAEVMNANITIKNMSGSLKVDALYIRTAFENDITLINTTFLAYNTHLDIDYLPSYYDEEKSRPNPHPLIDWNNAHRALRCLNSSVARFYNVTVTGVWSPTGDPPMITDDTSTVYIYRWIVVTVRDKKGTPVAGARVSYRYSGTDRNISAIIERNTNLSDGDVEDNYTLMYLNKTRSPYQEGYINNSTWNITGIDGTTILPLLSDVINSTTWPNSLFTGNYNLTANYTNSTYGNGSGSVEISTSYFPWMLAENNTQYIDIYMYDCEIPPPDLTPTAITFNPSQPYQSDDVMVTVNISNVEPTPADNVYVEVYDIYNGVSTKIYNTTIGHIIGNSTIPITFLWDSAMGTSNEGLHTIKVVVDPNNVIVERNETNNTMSRDIIIRALRPELIVASVNFYPISPYTGQSVYVNATVNNIGMKNATNILVRFYLGDPGNDPNSGNMIGEDTIEDIEYGKSAVASISWTVPVTAGTYRIYAWVDPLNNIAEYNETNNTNYGDLIVQPKPNLHIEDSYLGLSTKFALINENVTITIRIVNNGGSNVTTAFDICIFDDMDGNGKPSDGEHIGNITVSRINASESISKRYTFNLSARGTHRICAIVDINDTIDEIDESDNFACTMLYLFDPSVDMVVGDVAGESVTITAPDYAHYAGVFVENDGALIITGVLHLSGDKDDNKFVVCDNGELTINGGAIISDYSIGVEFYDNSTLQVSGATIGMDVVVNGTSDWYKNDINVSVDISGAHVVGNLYCYGGARSVVITNTTLPMIELYGDNHAELYNCTDSSGGYTTIYTYNTSRALRYWLLTVRCYDANMCPVSSANVSLYYNNPPPTLDKYGYSDSQGVVLFWALSENVSAGGVLRTYNYVVNATCTISGTTYRSNTSYPVMDRNRIAYLVFDTLRPDLVVSNMTVLNSQPIYHGDDVIVNVTVENCGLRAAYNVKVSLYVDSISGDAVDSAVISVLDVFPNNSTNVILHWTAAAGSHTLYAYVDPDNVTIETNETNNIGSIGVNIAAPKPDLEVRNVQVLVGGAPVTTISSGTTVTIRAEVHNIGNTPVYADFDVRFSYDGNEIAIERITQDIASGGYIVVSTTWTPQTTGTYTINVSADVNNEVDESDEGNNYNTTTLTVTPMPNLSAIDLYLDTKAPLVGQSTLIYAVVKNTGGVDVSGQVKVGYYVNGDFIGEEVINSINVGQEIALSHSWTPLSGGTYVLEARVDYTNSITESNEADNTASNETYVYDPNYDIIVDDDNTLIWDSVRVYQMGNILIKDNGTFIMRNSDLTMSMSQPYQYRITVMDNGEFVLIGCSISSNLPITVYLQDNCLLSTKDTDVASTVSFVLHGGATLKFFDTTAGGGITLYDGTHCIVKNTTLQYSIYLYNNSIADITSGSVPNPKVYDDSIANIFYYLYVNAYDGNMMPLDNATVYVYRAPDYSIPRYSDTTINGTAVFELQAYIMRSTETRFIGNYLTNATYSYGSNTYKSTNASVTLTHDTTVDLVFNNVLPNLDPTITVGKKVVDRGESTWINISGIANTGSSMAYDVKIAIYDYNYSETREGSYVEWYRIYSVGNISPGSSAYLNISWRGWYKIEKHHLVIVIDPYDEIKEYNENDNVNHTNITVTSKPDLVVDDVGFSPENPTEYTSTTIFVTISNIGDVPATGVPLQAYYYNGTTWVPAGSGIIGTTLDYDASTTTSISWTNLPAAGVYDVKIVVDADDSIIELNESNNDYLTSISIKHRADLMVTDLYITEGNYVVNNTFVQIICNITNQGETVAKDFKLEIGLVDLSAGTYSPIYNTTVSGLDPGGSTKTSVYWYASTKGATQREYIVRAYVDSTNVVPEIDDTTNNIAQYSVIVYDRRPNLRISASDIVMPENITEGKRFTVNITVHNVVVAVAKEPSAAKNVTIGVYDGNVSKPPVANTTISSIGPMSNVTVSLNITLRGVGNHTLIFYVDPGNYTNPKGVVDEYNESDNMVYMEVNVGLPLLNVLITSPEANKIFEIGGNAIVVSGRISPVPSNLSAVSVSVLVYKEGKLYSNISGVSPDASGVFYAYLGVPSDTGPYTIKAVVNYKGGIYESEAVNIVVKKAPIAVKTPWWVYIAIAIVIAAVFGATSWYMYRYGLGKFVECGECGAIIPAGSKKCPKCGIEFEKDTAKCSVCGAWIPADSEVCPECGAEFVVALEKEKEYRELMRAKYEEMLDKYREIAKKELGPEYSEEKFAEWWKNHPDYISFDAWLILQEEKRGKPIKCPQCGTLNPSTATICHKCGSPLPAPRVEEEKPPEEVKEVPEAPKVPKPPEKPKIEEKPPAAKAKEAPPKPTAPPERGAPPRIPAPKAPTPKVEAAKPEAPKAPVPEAEKKEVPVVPKKVIKREGPAEVPPKRVVIKRPVKKHVVAKKVVVKKPIKPKKEEEEKE